MAVRDYTVSIPRDRLGNNIMGAHIVTWTGLLNGDTGQPYPAPHRADKSVQLLGTLGGTPHCFIEGANGQVYTSAGADLSETYHTLNDPQGNALDMTALKIEQVLENTNAIRPRVTGDGSTNLTVVMLIGSSARL